MNEETKTAQSLRSHVEQIADTLTNPDKYREDYSETEAGEPNAMDWLEDALDIRYVVNGEGEFISAQVLVTFGGPNIWVNFDTKQVNGYWWNETATASFTDNLGVEDILGELWASR